jgi:hypothetical protein
MAWCLVLFVVVHATTDMMVVSLFSLAPLVAATVADERRTAVFAGAAVALAIGTGWLDGATGSVTYWIRVGVVCAICAMAVVVAGMRRRREERLARMTAVAEAAQLALLPPLPPEMTGITIAARYRSATREATVGGDLYEIIPTGHGIRVIIGDVRGKGLDAVRLASIVLGSYRHVAFERPDLSAVVADLDRAVSRSVGDEDFVTAALVEERGGTLTIINCGHPAPLLLRRGEVIPLEPPASAPPLGFMPAALPRVERLEPGDRLLLYTDGLAEARRDGEFFPTAARAWRLLGHGTVGDGLASLESALSEWVQGQLDDDIALVLMEYAGTASAPARAAVPSWELGAEA